VLAAGVLIDERHEIEQPLGRGGMAEVFRARDITTGRSSPSSSSGRSIRRVWAGSGPRSRCFADSITLE
jgi:hypothetical protein